MKKLHIVIVFLSFLMTACLSDEEGMIEFETFTVDKTVPLTSEKGSPICSVHMEMASATNVNGHKAEVINNTVMKRLLDIQDVSMKRAAENFAEEYTSSYIKNMLPLYNQDRIDSTRKAWYEYHYIIKTETRRGSKHTAAYLATVDYFEGGAHGINQLLTFNFLLKDGRHLQLSDIFASGYEPQLCKVLLLALQEKTGAKSLSELHEMGYLYSMDMFPSENFILDGEAITFIYNPYEIAPYAMGSTELVIPYSDLDTILKNSFEY